MTVRRVVLTSDVWCWTMRGAVLKLSCERSDFLASAILWARRLGPPSRPNARCATC